MYSLVLAMLSQENGGLWRHRLQHIERKILLSYRDFEMLPNCCGGYKDVSMTL